MKNRIKQRQRQNRSIRVMQNKKQNLEVGQRVYVDFFSSNSVETDGTRISGFGVLDRVEPDGFVCGRLDIGHTFGCPSQYVQPQSEVIGIDLGKEISKSTNKNRLDFEESIKASASYQKLVFMHGEKLFIFDDEKYKIAAIQLAWEIYCERQEVITNLRGSIKEYCGWVKDLKHERGFLQQVCAQRADTIEALEKVFNKSIELVELDILGAEQSRNTAVDMQERNYFSAMLYFLRPIQRQLAEASNIKIRSIKKDSDVFEENSQQIDKSVPAAILEATEKRRGDKC